MKHLMIDIETLDTAITAVVPQVGWCLFDEHEIKPPVELAIDIDEQIKMGRTVSASTLQWWMKQPDIARERVFSPDKVHSVNDLAIRLRTLLHDNAVEYVWAHGPQFDIATLRHLLGIEPWHYRSIRDTRTLAMLAPSVPKPAPLTKHSAGDDAYAQAKWVQNIWRHIGWPNKGEQSA